MRVLALTPPGRFPTVIFDLGLWWDAVAATGRHDLQRFSANHAWWRTICSPRLKALALAPLGALDQMRQRALWRARNLDLKADASAASRSLHALRTPAPYRSMPAYLDTLAPLARYLEDLNRAQVEFGVSIDAGPRVRHLNYSDSASLVDYSERESLLGRSIEAALDDCPTGLGFVALSVTCPEDLLTALIAANHLRARNPAVHISLVDHGYENFSLHLHIETLRRAGTLDRIFDTIIASKDERDDLVPALIDAVADGRAPRGYLTRASLPDALPRAHGRFFPPPPLPSFAPEPIVWTRLSKRRCYWSQCTYCTQNSKYADPSAPSHPEILRAVDRIEAFIAAGYRHYIFSDEALSPSTLRLLADVVDERGLQFHWACRCKLERAHTAELFDRLGKAGCYEILYGLETTSPRILKLMKKYVAGLDEAHVTRVLREMESAGISAHVNLIGGYPGDTLGETERSVEFLVRAFSTLRGGTYVLNGFALLADTPIARTPNEFGVARVTTEGDIAQVHGFELAPELCDATDEVLRDIPRLRQRLNDELGWTGLGQGPEAAMAQALYFGSGHGSVFKTMTENPFANPLLARSQSRRAGQAVGA